MRVLLLGDLHGAFGRLYEVIQEAHDILGVEAVIQVGDFGLDSDAALACKHLTRRHGRLPIPLHVIDGNHEDHAWADNNQAWGKAHNIQVHRRATILQLAERNILLCGGALNVDRPQTPVPNYVTEQNVQDCLAVLAGQVPDVVITHSCPSGIGIRMPGLKTNWILPAIAKFITQAGFPTCPEDDPGEVLLARLWDQMPHRPQHWIFGHFHQLRQSRVGDTTFSCVGSTDGSDGSSRVRPVILNLENLTVNVSSELLGTSLGGR